MARGTKATLQVAGEENFNESLRTMVAQLRAVNSELVLTAAKFEGQEKSVEALTASQEVYKKQSETLVREIALLEKGVQAAGEQFGENSREVADLQNKLNKAQTELVKSGRALDDLDEALEDAAKSTEDFNDAVDSTDEKGKGLGDVLDGLTGKFGVSLPENMRSTLDEMIQIDAQTLALVGGLAALATAIASAERALIDLTREQAALASQTLDFAATVNMDVEAVQEWDYVLKSVGSSMEEAQGDLSALQEKMNDARDTTSEAGQLFAQLGVSVTNADGSLRGVDDVLTDVVTSLSNMEDESRRNAISSELLSTTGEKLAAVYEMDDGALQDLIETKRQNGIMTEKELKQLDAVDNAFRDLTETTENAKNQLAVEFAPSLIDVTEKLTALIDDLGEALVDSGAVDAFGSILESAMDLIMPTSELSEDGVPQLTEALKPLAQMLALVADTMSAIAGLAHILTGIMHLDFSQVGEGWEMMTTAFGLNASSGQLSAQQKLNYKNALQSQSYNAAAGGYVGSSYAQYEEDSRNGFAGSYEYWLQQRSRNSTGNTNWRGGLTWVGENGPELTYLPRGTQILNATESREVVGGDTFYITIDAKNVREFNEIVRIAQTARMNARKGVSG